MLYLFHGEDEFRRAEAIDQLRQKMDPVMGDLNTVTLTGRTLSIGELRAACDTIPFMASCRLVIVHDLVSSSAGGKGAKHEHSEMAGDEDRLHELEGYLPQIPESTKLVLDESKTLKEGSRLLKAAKAVGAFVRAFPIPTGPELNDWIRRRAQGKGVSIAPNATALLAAYVGSDTRQLEQELEKLSLYVGEGATISRADVEQLVTSLQEADIFHMVDALGGRDRRRALRILHQFLDEGKHPLYLLTMITRQFRLLLQARELDAQGASPAEMAQQMQVHPFVAKKTLQQALNFRPGDLRAILGQLLDIDVSIKTGQMEGPLALDLFVVRWTAR